MFIFQLVELESVSENISPQLLKHGMEIELPFDGKPLKEGRDIVDPLKDNSYVVNFNGEGGQEQSAKIKIGNKIWFDSEIINDE